MIQRVLTALLLLPAAVAAVLLLPSPWFMALAAALLLLGLWEWTRLSGITGTAERLVLVGAHAALMAVLARYGWPHLFVPIVLLGVLWWLLAIAWLRRFEFGADLGRRRNRVLALASGTLAMIPAWCALALLHTGPLGPRWTLFAVALVWAADTGAFFAGRRFGARTPKLAPVISPNKTWAGVWGGMLLCVLFTTAVAPLLGVSWGQLPALLGLALVAAVASIVGDLYESMLKRHAGAKDSGALIPGHGGVLDRMDSMLAALPVFAVGHSILGL